VALLLFFVFIFRHLLFDKLICINCLLVFFQNAASDALLKFYYPPVAAVSISYKKDAIRRECLIDGELKGFGQLHPRSQGVETLGPFPFLFSFLIDMPLVSYI